MRKSFNGALLPAAMLATLAGGLFAGRASADQPYMHSALDQLRAARASLAAGAPDKGGHRVRAMALVDQAIAEVHAGIGYERAN